MSTPVPPGLTTSTPGHGARAAQLGPTASVLPFPDRRPVPVSAPASASAQVPTLADVIACIGSADLAPVHKRDMLSALRSAARLFGTEPERIPADLRDLQARFAAVLPASAGVSPVRLANIRSLVLGALRLAGRRILPGRARDRLSPPWTALRATLPVPPPKPGPRTKLDQRTKLGQRLRPGLSRFMHFCSREGIDPAAVGDAAFAAFRQTLEQHSLVDKPGPLHRATCVLWNLAAARVEGWPAYQAAVPSLSRNYAWSWTDFPASFAADAQAFLHHGGNRDVLSDDFAPSVEASTVDLRRKQILQVATALVRSGFPVEALTSLAVLVQEANVRLACRFLLDRKGGALTPYLHQQVQLTRTIARHWVKVESKTKAEARRAAEAKARTVEALGKLCRNLVVKRTGMTAKNRARLEQFDDPAKVRDLLRLPRQVLHQAKAQRGGGQAGDGKAEGVQDGALRLTLALAVELLITTAVRIENLADLELDRHVVRKQVGTRSVVHIVLSKEETKNDAPFEAELPAGTAAFVTAYLARAHRRMAPGGSAFLFPGRGGGRRCTAAFATTIGRFVQRETGLVMNVHLFRALAVKLYLAAHPGDIETPRRMLGHRSPATTWRSYVEDGTAACFRRYDEVIAALRDPAPPSRRGVQATRRRP